MIRRVERVFLAATNQKDIAMRMRCFDHTLKGPPAPAWMTKGIPYRSKGKDQLNGSTPAAPAIPQQP